MVIWKKSVALAIDLVVNGLEIDLLHLARQSGWGVLEFLGGHFVVWLKSMYFSTVPSYLVDGIRQIF